MSKTLTFADENGLRTMRQREPGKWAVGMILISFECVWKWAGSRGGLQEVREVGEGWDGWYWRSSVGDWSVGR
jgi:hypothetical protein